MISYSCRSGFIETNMDMRQLQCLQRSTLNARLNLGVTWILLMSDVCEKFLLFITSAGNLCFQWWIQTRNTNTNSSAIFVEVQRIETCPLAVKAKIIKINFFSHCLSLDYNYPNSMFYMYRFIGIRHRLNISVVQKGTALHYDC